MEQDAAINSYFCACGGGNLSVCSCFVFVVGQLDYLLLVSRSWWGGCAVHSCVAALLWWNDAVFVLISDTLW